MECARHPKVETELACGRCGTPICPRCLVMTDVGARCPTCAPARKLPQFELGPVWLLRGATAALALGGALGGLWWLILPRGFGFFALILAVLAGYAMGEGVSWATNRKAGPPLQAAAAAGIVVAFLVRNLLLGESLLPAGDFWGYLFVLVAAFVAASRLRY